MVAFRGREGAHMEFGQKIVDKLKADLSDVAESGPNPRMEGRMLTLTFMPKTLDKSSASS